MKSYLSNSSQQVHLDGTKSEELYLGNQSVIQGSVMFKQTIGQNIEEDRKDINATTFVDNSAITVPMDKDKQYKGQIDYAMNKIEYYMISNQLVLNRDKTQLLDISKHPNCKDNLHIKDNNEIIKPF